MTGTKGPVTDDDIKGLFQSLALLLSDMNIQLTYCNMLEGSFGGRNEKILGHIAPNDGPYWSKLIGSLQDIKINHCECLTDMFRNDTISTIMEDLYGLFYHNSNNWDTLRKQFAVGV